MHPRHVSSKRANQDGAEHRSGRQPRTALGHRDCRCFTSRRPGGARAPGKSAKVLLLSAWKARFPGGPREGAQRRSRTLGEGNEGLAEPFLVWRAGSAGERLSQPHRAPWFRFNSLWKGFVSPALTAADGALPWPGRGRFLRSRAQSLAFSALSFECGALLSPIDSGEPIFTKTPFTEECVTGNQSVFRRFYRSGMVSGRDAAGFGDEDAVAGSRARPPWGRRPGTRTARCAEAL